MLNFSVRFAAPIALSIALQWAAVPAHGQDAAADKQGSQAAYLRGQRLDLAGRRIEAVAAYTEAIAADGGNGAAWTARAKDYLAARQQQQAKGELVPPLPPPA